MCVPLSRSDQKLPLQHKLNTVGEVVHFGHQSILHIYKVVGVQRNSHKFPPPPEDLDWDLVCLH